MEAWEIAVASSAVEACEYDDEEATDNVMVQNRTDEERCEGRPRESLGREF